MTAPSYSSFTFPTADLMSFTGFNGNDAYFALYSEEAWVRYESEVSSSAWLIGGAVGAALAEGISNTSDGYALATRYSYDNTGMNEAETRGTCVSVSSKMIRCTYTYNSFLGKSYWTYRGDLASGATAPAAGVNIISDYTLVTQTSYAGAAGWFACDAEESGSTVTTTCFLLQVPESQESDTDYRFDMESPNDGTVNFWLVTNNVLGDPITVSDWKSAVSGVAAATGAVALALLSF